MELKALPEGKEKFRKISQLANDFVYCANTYGKIILAEVCLPVEEKTVKYLHSPLYSINTSIHRPVAVGGLAGGTKVRIS